LLLRPAKIDSSIGRLCGRFALEALLRQSVLFLRFDGLFNRSTVKPTELLEIFPAGGEKRMIRGERYCRDRVRPPEAALGLVDFSSALAHHAEVVQRVGEVWMQRPELALLQRSCFTKKPRRRGVVVRRCGLFRSVHDVLDIGPHLV